MVVAGSDSDDAVPGLPDAGVTSENNTSLWKILIPAVAALAFTAYLVKRSENQKSSSKNV